MNAMYMYILHVHVCTKIAEVTISTGCGCESLERVLCSGKRAASVALPALEGLLLSTKLQVAARKGLMGRRGPAVLTSADDWRDTAFK